MQQWAQAAFSGHFAARPPSACKRRVLGAGYGSEMATVLITQCLQRDFVDPIGPHDPLPNLLHVGYSEAARLLGPEPAAGPLAQLIEWARGLPSDAIDLV